MNGIILSYISVTTNVALTYRKTGPGLNLGRCIGSDGGSRESDEYGKRRPCSGTGRSIGELDGMSIIALSSI